MSKNVVRGFSLVRTTLKGRTTKGGLHNDRRSLPAFFIVIAREARQSQESKTQKSKGKMTEQK